MNKAARESGYARWSKLATFALVAAIVYGAVALGPAVLSYYRIKQDARRLAYRTLDVGVDADRQIDIFLEVVREREKLAISDHDIGFERNDEQVNVSVRLSLPIKLPWIDKNYRWDTVAEAAAIRSRGF